MATSGSLHPDDVPPQRPASLSRLDILVGQWEMEMAIPGGFFSPDSAPITAEGGRTTFAWLAGEFFLVQQFRHAVSEAPSGLAIIGSGEGNDEFLQHYYDSRGVARTYHMTMQDGVWKLWRQAPGFSQRYIGSLSADGNQISGSWEKSADGSDWQHDFELTYRRVGPPSDPSPITGLLQG